MAILITGAAGGLGNAVIEAFLGTGATVYGADMLWKHQPHANPRFHPIEANLLSSAECDRVIQLATPVEAVLHLVGGFAGGQTVAETPDETWQQMLDLNLRSACLILRAALPHMVKAGRGRIVAVGARAALDPMQNFGAYSVSKSALVALIKTTAREFQASGITANVVLPSTIDTPGNRAAMPNADFSKWVAPESIADLMVWLVSDSGRDVNGAAIPIYGRA